MNVGSKRLRRDLFGDQYYKTLAERDAHPLYARKPVVQLFYVAEEEKTYHLIGGNTNQHWKEYKVGSAGDQLETPFNIKRSSPPTGPLEHDGTPIGFLRAIFAPFLNPTISLNASPAVIEVGYASTETVSGSVNARGEATTFRNFRIIRNGLLVAQGTNYSYSPKPTTEAAITYGFSALWDGNGKTDQLLTATGQILHRFPYWTGKSANAALNAANWLNGASNRTKAVLNASSFTLAVTTTSGDHIYVVIPAGKSITSIQDVADNGAAVPLSTLQLVDNGSTLQVPDTLVPVPYSYPVKIYRTVALGAASFHWRINL